MTQHPSKTLPDWENLARALIEHWYLGLGF